MIEFVDKTTTQSGTPINRVNLMAIQGFVAKSTVFENGSIIETNSNGEKLTTVFDQNGSIVETFEGKYKLTKTTTFDGGNITEVIA